MNTLKKVLQYIVPPIMGAYCLVQGGALLMSEDPTTRLVGVAVMLWLPGCAYYTWRGSKALLEHTAAGQARPESLETKLAA